MTDNAVNNTQQRPCHKSRGFTLLELIAVMAIIAMLAGALVPNIFDAIKRARADVEVKNLSSIGQSIVLSVVIKKSMPTAVTSSWVAAVQTSSDFSATDIEFNALNYRRRLIFDPRFFTTTDAVFQGHSQNYGLQNRPNSPRAILISDLSNNVAAVANTASVFNAIWDQTSTATLVESSDLKIQRLNFTNKFHRILLSNQHISQPYFQLEAGTTYPILAATDGVETSLTRYVIDNTKISLFSTTGKELVHIVKSDWSARYKTDGGWTE
ncbi:MAG: prepilin-type N-terminal cleavage/methylation domain-containing protein [Gammaproteobacteria bacterium]|nr:prepilin-type N-terminal cleavage/methylation domain-containing protein [Gammaproteobacteria bacterium]